MREVVLQMHMTLDGFADSREGFVPIGDRHYWKEVDQALRLTGAAKTDTLLLGRGTYNQFSRFWPKTLADPKSPRSWREQARSIVETPKVVFSKSLRSPKMKNTTIVRGSLRSEIQRLKRRPGKNLLVLGGVAFPRALIEEDLVDEYLLAVVPIILGQGGYRLFGPLSRARNLQHLRSWTFSNGVVLHRYRRKR